MKRFGVKVEENWGGGGRQLFIDEQRGAICTILKSVTAEFFASPTLDRFIQSKTSVKQETRSHDLFEQLFSKKKKKTRFS